MRQAYQPKNGDFKNLQLFADSLAGSFDPRQLAAEYNYPRVHVMMFLCLPNGGLAWIYFSDQPFLEGIGEIFLNGAVMDDSGLLLQQSPRSNVLDMVSARIFLPRAQRKITERCADCDVVLDFITRRPWREQDSWLEIVAAQGTGDKHLEHYFFASNLLAFLEKFRSKAIQKIHLSHLQLPEDMWQRLSLIECSSFSSRHVLIPCLFWRQTRAKWVTFSGARFILSEQEIECILSGLQSRATPVA